MGQFFKGLCIGLITIAIISSNTYASNYYTSNQIELSDWNGDFKGNTLTDWMKHDSDKKNGVNSKATGVFVPSIKIPQSSDLLQKLTLNIVSGYAADDRTNLEIYRGSNGIFYAKFTSMELSKEILVPFTQSNNKLAVKLTDHAAGSEFKYGEKLEFLNDKLILTNEFSCCVVSFGHAGCLVHGMCSNIYTFSK
ncbi:MAG: hypothetical protein PHY93_17630 [Bacteriovorax sp.]|nr:hypothetical protein [Bacteriovorax sp.]